MKAAGRIFESLREKKSKKTQMNEMGIENEKKRREMRERKKVRCKRAISKGDVLNG